ncbi:MAG: SRPBCC domain-containing protein [Curvibacter sp.]|nr:SRPBCC domain-containing protein [Curvibacter sp.]
MSTFKTSRAFQASAATVFAAFSAPERLARWWGPDGFSNTFEVFEFRNGGHWRFTMHGPDGARYPNEAVFERIDAEREVVLRHVSQPHFTLSIRLEATDQGTTVHWEQAFDSPEVAAALRPIVEPANEQNLRRWQAELDRPGQAG